MNATALDMPSALDVHPDRVRMLDVYFGGGVYTEGHQEPMGVLVTSTPGLYVGFTTTPCDDCLDSFEGRACWHRPIVDWYVVAECGLRVTDHLTKPLAIGLAVALSDVSVDWRLPRDQMLRLRERGSGAWLAAGEIVAVWRSAVMYDDLEHIEHPVGES